MSYIIYLRCDDCGAEYSHMEKINTCHKCGGLLDAYYDHEKMKKEMYLDKISKRKRDLWRWRELLPVSDESNIVTLGEGSTPLLKCVHIAKILGIKNYYVKNDTMNPTSSFKDRSFSVAISKAKEIGVKLGLIYTAGNAGASFAAYMAKAGMDSVILVKEWATREKIGMIKIYGPKMVKLAFDSFSEVTTMLEHVEKNLGIYQFGVFINPFRHEGNKTYAYEMWEDLDGRIPEIMIHPVSHGGGIYGAYKGFKDLIALGLSDRLPRMIAAQPVGSQPIVKAFNEGKNEAERFGNPKGTIAQSIGTDAPIGKGKRILKCLFDSGGCAVAVSDEEMLEAMKWLGKEGIFAEPSAAISVAAAKKLIERGEVKDDETCVSVVTGSGLKQTEASYLAMGEGLGMIRARYEELERFIKP
jgi:threonine synthase